MPSIAFPRPPTDMADPASIEAPWFAPAHDLVEWMTETFISPDGLLANEEHLHLNAARLGALWTCVPHAKQGRTVLGQCEFRPPGGTMGKWQRARASFQLRGWFGGDLDFLLTFDARYAATCSEAQFCALVEHELYHCGQAKDEFGDPRFIGESGIPAFCMRGHDVEEFVGIVRRYGAVTPDLQALLDAADVPPEIEAAAISAACGTCHA